MYNNLLLPKDTFLGEVISFIPANKIIYKYLTGCGATHLEIFCNRWSIIIEPYIPVILGKRWMEKVDENGNKVLDADGNVVMVKNPEVLAVYERTHKDDIVDFLSEKHEKYKLISTPEGMVKIMQACAELEIDPFEKFFLLVDECEKLIQDAKFRTEITTVMDYFFQFKKRSFVSATPIPPSDKRFEQYGFSNFYIHPKKDEKIKIDLYTTHNIASTLKNYLRNNVNNYYLIFLNSTERIASVVKFLKIEDETQVFCSRESWDILNINNIPNVSEHWDSKKVRKYNFFTSRFFTAFDIKLKFKPNVLIISDYKKVRHSGLDPQTDIIQIAGRARFGIKHLAHITNWDAHPILSEIEIKTCVSTLRECYKFMEQLKDQCQNNGNYGTYQVLSKAMETFRYRNYLNTRTLEECPYMIDNEIHANRVAGYYKNRGTILQAYLDAERFRVKHISESYNLSDENLDILKSGLSKKETLKSICEMFHFYFEQEKEIYNLTPNHALLNLIQTHQQKYQYYKLLGIDRLRELNFSTSAIEKEYTLKKIESTPSYFTLTHTLSFIFREDKCFTGNKIRKILEHYFAKYKVKLPATLNQLRKWFDVPSERITLGYRADGGEIKGYRIGKPKNAVILPRSFRQ